MLCSSERGFVGKALRCMRNITLKSPVVEYKCVCLLPKPLSPSVLCFRHLGPYLMFYHFDSSCLIKYVCFYLSNLFTSPPQGAFSFVSYSSPLPDAIFSHPSLMHCNLS